MCSTCGCGQPEHDHQHGHHHHDHEHETKVTLETDILAENNRFAADNRKFFYQNDIAAYNLVSSPGSGKTT
ncbi:MAG: hydrogenase accessory protein HypB, partial [Muribaculaceae bacterium]|nr:hydrogenase accessory protein HypB [Muribaculaceae bacterium]